MTVHWIGTPRDFLKVPGQGDEEKGYYPGEYADFMDTSMLRDQYMPAEVIAPVVNLPRCTVISSACAGGVETMGRAFVGTGTIRAYIVCRDYPNGDDMLVYPVNFFHGILRKQLSDRDAWQRTMVVTDQPKIYEISFFHADGTEERYNRHCTEKEKTTWIHFM